MFGNKNEIAVLFSNHIKYVNLMPYMFSYKEFTLIEHKVHGSNDRKVANTLSHCLLRYRYTMQYFYVLVM